MIKKKNKSSIKFYFSAPILIAVVVFLFFHNLYLFLDYYNLKKENIGLIDKVNKEKIKIENIENNIKYLDSENGISKAILETNSMKKEGERVIEIINY